MYFLYSFVTILLLISVNQFLYSQQTDPLNKTPTLLESSEIVIVWSEKISGTNDYQFGQKIYDYNDANPTPPNQLITGIKDDEGNAIHNSQVAVVTGNFNDDDKTDAVSAYVNTDNKVRLVLPHINPQNFGWPQVSSVLSDGSITTASEYYKRMKLKTGDFDDDSEDEIILVYIDTDDTASDFNDDGKDEIV